MRTAAFLTRLRRGSHCLGHIQQRAGLEATDEIVVETHRGIADAQSRIAFPEATNPIESALKRVGVAHQSRPLAHQLAQVGLDLSERLAGVGGGIADQRGKPLLLVAQPGRWKWLFLRRFGERGSRLAGRASEDDRLGEDVAGQPAGAVEPVAGAFARGEKSGYRAFTAGVWLDSANRAMRSGRNRNRVFREI